MSEKNGDYCQKCGVSVDPTDEKCSNGHVLAEVGRSFVRSASAEIKVTAIAKTKKSNDFDKIIDEFGTEAEEADLVKMRDIKVDFISKMYILMLGLIIQATLLFRDIKPVENSSPFVSVSFMFGFLLTLFLFVYVVYEFLNKDPHQSQRNILKDFIKARTRLREIKKGNKPS